MEKSDVPIVFKPVPGQPSTELSRGSAKTGGNSVVRQLDPRKFEGTDDGQQAGEQFSDFYKSILDQNKSYPPPPPLINLICNGEAVPVLTEKSFSLWQGKQKSKKTIALAIMAAAFLRQQLCSDSIYFEGKGKGKILWFDCEQGESYAARTMQLILNLSGQQTSDRLIYCDTREYTPNHRMKIIESGIVATSDASIVVIDGLVDLMNDFMEAAEAHSIITKLLTFCSAYNLHIAGVLHQNKADRQARAHIGSIASQKCEIEITAEVDPDDKARSIISCVNCRGLPFEPFAIRWDKSSMPCIDQDYRQAGTKKEVMNMRNYEKGKQVAEVVFKPFNALSYSEAAKAIAAEEKTSIPTANRRIKDFVAWGLVEQGADGKYRKKMQS